MEVENRPFGDKPRIFQDPIFHETMIMEGRVLFNDVLVLLSTKKLPIRNDFT